MCVHRCIGIFGVRTLTGNVIIRSLEREFIWNNVIKVLRYFQKENIGLRSTCLSTWRKELKISTNAFEFQFTMVYSQRILLYRQYKKKYGPILLIETE